MDFTSGKWQARRGNSQLLASILDGKGAQMPAFRDRLYAEQARQLIGFIRSFGPARKASKTEDLDDFDTRLQQLEKQLEELQKQFRQLSRRED